MILLKYTLAHRCTNIPAKFYVTELIYKVQNLFSDKQRREEFKKLYREDFQHKFDLNILLKAQGKWNKKPGPQRKYYAINDYYPVIDREDTLSRLQTSKTSQCNGDCCNAYEKLGPIAPTEDYWLSDCPCRKNKVEWNEKWGCHFTETCKNRQIKNRNSLKLGIDVKEVISWGLDVYTCYNIMYMLPSNLDFCVKYNFIMHTLGKSLMKQNENGWDIWESLRYIIDSPKVFTKVEQELAEIVLSGIEGKPKLQEEYFRIYCKGLGVVWNKPEGIKANEFIIEYFGEIYPSWRWYEKEDVIKHGQNSKKLSKELPDFYNIIFERHIDDPEGYNCLTVDPILRGSYASRLSHSCYPNWATVIHINDGKYSIGMFATRDIKYGEELSFDYKSVTESEKEYESAICLCGSFKCLGRFLGLSHSKKFTAVMKKSHTFLDRNYLLFYACTNPVITLEDREILNRHGIKSSLITWDVPPWLEKWASLILRYWEYECQHIIKPLKEMNPTYTDFQWELESKNILSNRISNIAITIDKVKHWLIKMNTQVPPLRLMTFQETYLKFWDKESTFRPSLFSLLEKLEPWDETDECLGLFWKAADVSNNPEIIEEETYRQMFIKVLDYLRQMSFVIRKIKSRAVFTEALADILYLYSHTYTYFTPNDIYFRFKSQEVNVRRWEVTWDPKYREKKSDNYPIEEERVVFKGAKEYDPLYIWGQLTGWYKQSVDKPNASLSADRRGTLSYPDLDSFDLQKPLKKSRRPKQKKNNKDYAYDYDMEELSDDDSPKVKKKPKRRANKSAVSEHLHPQNDEEIKDWAIERDQTPNPYWAEDNLQAASVADYYEDDEEDDFEELLLYPHRKHHNRNDFLKSWRENFSKQWDVNSKWFFKNKQRMYGSVQFESLIQSNLEFGPERLSYFHQVIDGLLDFEN